MQISESMPFSKDDFIPLDETIRAEFQKWGDIGKSLVPLWQNRTPPRAQHHASQYSIDVEIWKKSLTHDIVGGYISAFGAHIRGLLLDHSTSHLIAEGTLFIPENEPVNFKLRYNQKIVPQQNTHQISEEQFIVVMGQYCGDRNPFAVTYIADSLRRQELCELPKLQLAPLMDNSILVTLDL